jgi:hypothetical protein
MNEQQTDSVPIVKPLSFSTKFFESRILTSLDTSLASLKQQFLVELQLLLDCCTYDDSITTFTRQLHHELRAIFSSAESPRTVEIPMSSINENFNTLTLPQTLRTSTNSDPFTEQITGINRHFTDSTTNILSKSIKAHREIRQMKTLSIDSSCRAADRLMKAQFKTEAVEIEHRILKEHLNSRFQKLTLEKTAFHDRQTDHFSDIENFSSNPSINSFHRRNSLQLLTGKVHSLSCILEDIKSTIHLLNSHIFVSSEAFFHIQNQCFSNKASSQERDVLTTVKATLKAIQHHRETIPHHSRFLSSF